MKTKVARTASWLTILILTCACQNNVSSEISNIYVDIASPDRSIIKVEKFEINNCEGATALSYTLGDIAAVSKEVKEEGLATINSGDEYQITEFSKLLLKQAIENAYEQTYQTEIDKLKKTTLEAVPNKHIIFMIEIQKLTFAKTVEFTIQNDVYESDYVYELTRPNLKGSNFIKCPDSTEQVVRPTFTPENQKIYSATLKQSTFLYNGPHLNYGKAYDDKLNIGDIVWIVAKSNGGDWFLVETDQGHQGWLYIAWIDIEFDISAIRIETSIPPVPTSTPRQVKDQQKDAPPYPNP